MLTIYKCNSESVFHSPPNLLAVVEAKRITGHVTDEEMLCSLFLFARSMRKLHVLASFLYIGMSE